MTPKKAKELSLEVWRYLAEHPEIREKRNLPQEIYKKIEGLLCSCPLCELLYGCRAVCPKCPLGRCNENSYFYIWANTYSYENKARQSAAQKIVAAIEAWEPEER